MKVADTEGNESEIVKSNDLEVTTLVDAIILAFNDTGYNSLSTVVSNGDTINQTRLAVNSNYASHSLYSKDGRHLLDRLVILNSSYYEANEIFNNGGTYSTYNSNSQSVADGSGIYPVSVF